MALKLPDSAVPMGDFPVAKAVDIDFDDGENLQEKLDNGKLGGGGNVTDEVVKKTDITDTIDINSSKIPNVKAIYNDIIEGKPIDQTVIDVYGTEILKYPIGIWRIRDDNISKKFSDLPDKTSGRIEITSIDDNINRNPWDDTWGYRVYNFETYNGMNYFRKLGSYGTAGDLGYDTGWQKIATQKDLDELFQSVSSGKTLVANAITDKGVSTATDATFATMASNISKINANGYKEETVSYDKTSTGTNRIIVTFSADVYGVKQITPPSDASSNMVPETSTSMFTINGRKLTLYVNGRGTWKVTAIVRNA